MNWGQIGLSITVSLCSPFQKDKLFIWPKIDFGNDLIWYIQDLWGGIDAIDAILISKER